VIEPDVIEPEPAAAAPRLGGRRRAAVAGVTLLAVVAGGLAVASGGHRPKAAPLALLAGTGPQSEARSMAAPAAADAAIAPYPGGGWGLEFRVDGALADPGDHATAWKVAGPALDQAAVARIAGALGVTGTPQARDRGWYIDDGDRTLAATPAGDTWLVSYYGSSAPDLAVTNSAGSTTAGPTTAAGGAVPPAGPALSRVEVEQRVRELLQRMGAPAADWQAEVTETEIGPGWACAAPAFPGELTKEEADKLRLQGTAAVPTTRAAPPVATAPPPARKPAPDTLVGSGAASGGATGSSGSVGVATPACPPPPAPVKGFSVALFPVLDGHRAEWAVWNVTLRSDGRVENLYGSWAAFDRAGDYRLRTVDAALKDLTSGPRPLPAVANSTIAEDLPAIAVAPASPQAAPAGSTGQSGSAGAGSAGAGTVASGVAVPAIAPADCPPVAVPLAPEKGTSSYMPACAPPVPQVVTITGVELGLMQAPAFEDGQVRLLLVPAYRFLGHFDNGSGWETSVIALHPDSIAPPPNVPIPGDAREVGGIGASGQAVPPTPPDAAAR
jgi:hypothetical protein